MNYCEAGKRYLNDHTSTALARSLSEIKSLGCPRYYLLRPWLLPPPPSLPLFLPFTPRLLAICLLSLITISPPPHSPLYYPPPLPPVAPIVLSRVALPSPLKLPPPPSTGRASSSSIPTAGAMPSSGSTSARSSSPLATTSPFSP